MKTLQSKAVNTNGIEPATSVVVNDGSTANRRDKVISIDGAEKGNPATAMQSLSHEVGHATYNFKKVAVLPDVISAEGSPFGVRTICAWPLDQP